MGLYSWSQWSHSISVSASYMAASPTNDPNQAHGKANGDTSRATASRQFELAKCQRSWSSPSAQLAETVTERLQSVLCHPSKSLQAIYTELLHASCRYRAVREQEQERPPRWSCVFPMIERP